MAGDAIAPIWAAEGVDPDPDLGLYDGPYLHPFPDLLGQRPDAATVRPTRPAHIDGGEGLAAPGWATGFGQDRPAIWVGFGTEMSPLAPWPAVIEAVADLDADVVLTIGPMLDPDSFGPTSTNVRVERYVPARFLLDRVTAVLCHGGAGSVLATLARGVPLVVVPLGADQWENAAAVERAGAGLVLDVDRRTAGEISGALEQVLSSSSPFRAGAGAVASELAAMPPLETRLPEIEHLAG